jgi:hypothetical protein
MGIRWAYGWGIGQWLRDDLDFDPCFLEKSQFGLFKLLGGNLFDGPDARFDGEPFDLHGVLLKRDFGREKADFGDGMAFYCEKDLPRSIVGTEEKGRRN